jgi:DNA polymerase III delta' subunit
MTWGLIGLEKAKASLSDMLKSQRLPHGLLFYGTFGTGKFSLAQALAQAVNCQQPEEDMSPCKRCVSCLKIAEGTHPDVTILTPQSKKNTIRIDDIRDLKETLSFRPYEGKYKVAIIRQAERLLQEAGGALLKTLEEPTPETLLILTADSESSVMETLVSRCIRIKVSPLSRSQVRETLLKKGFELKSALLLSGLSGGALGAALYHNPVQALSIWDNIDSIFGISNRAAYLQAAVEWSAQLVETVEKIDKKEDDPKVKANYLALVLNCLRLWWRDVSVLAATLDREALLGPPPSVNQRRWSQKITARMIGRHEESMAKLTDGLGRSIKTVNLFENYWLEVSEFL